METFNIVKCGVSCRCGRQLHNMNLVSLLVHISWFGYFDAENLINFQYIIGDLRGAGWSVRTVRENDSISDNDLYHVFKKVDIDNNQEITTMVGEGRGCVILLIRRCFRSLD